MPDMTAGSRNAPAEGTFVVRAGPGEGPRTSETLGEPIDSVTFLPERLAQSRRRGTGGGEQLRLDDPAQVPPNRDLPSFGDVLGDAGRRPLAGRSENAVDHVLED